MRELTCERIAFIIIGIVIANAWIGTNWLIGV